MLIFAKHIRLLSAMGPSIYDVHTEGEGGVRLRWTHVDGGGGPAPCGRPHRKLKLESTHVVLSSSHAKKLVSILPEFRLSTEYKVEILRRYKLVIKITNSTVLNKF